MKIIIIQLCINLFFFIGCIFLFLSYLGNNLILCIIFAFGAYFNIYNAIDDIESIKWLILIRKIEKKIDIMNKKIDDKEL